MNLFGPITRLSIDRKGRKQMDSAARHAKAGKTTPCVPRFRASALLCEKACRHLKPTVAATQPVLQPNRYFLPRTGRRQTLGARIRATGDNSAKGTLASPTHRTPASTCGKATHGAGRPPSPAGKTAGRCSPRPALQERANDGPFGRRKGRRLGISIDHRPSPESPSRNPGKGPIRRPIFSRGLGRHTAPAFG